MSAIRLNEFEIMSDIRLAGGGICKGDAKLVSDTINEWKYGAAAVIYWSSFEMQPEVFRATVKPLAEAAAHNALITGHQVFLLNLMGDWTAYPELEEPNPPNGYWWMRILYERACLQVCILTPSYRSERNQVWEMQTQT